MKTFLWILFVLLAVLIGLYPLGYLFFDMRQGFLASKSAELLQNAVWQWAFYQHIFFGAIALLTGWSQFSKRFRNKYLNAHRILGKIYLISVLISGTAGLFIAFYATGGIVAAAGFTGLAICWVFASLQAYTAIRRMEINEHQYWMIRSYALCFSAVTLRLWLPIFQFGFAMEFLFAYRIIAWFCWVPNLMVAELIIRKLKETHTPLKVPA